MRRATKIRAVSVGIAAVGLSAHLPGCTDHRSLPLSEKPGLPTAEMSTAERSEWSMTGSSATGPASTRPKYVSPLDFWDFQSVIGDPPAESSSEHREELDQLLALQAVRSPDQVRQCQQEDDLTVFAFADVMGSWFTERSLPLTTKLMLDVTSDTRITVNAAKQVWKRSRPSMSDARIKPCVKMDPSPSYPSGNAARGIVFATLLVRAFPDKADALLARAKSIGDHRLIGGMHWPTDVYAGQILGIALARKFEANGQFLAQWEAVEEELKSANKP